MNDEPPVQWPSAGDAVEVIPASVPGTYLCWVESGDGEFTVSAGVDAALNPVTLSVGERLEMVWRSAGELRSFPAELIGVCVGERPMWRMRPAGVVRRGQRRDAVRAPLSLPMRLTASSATVAATTVDLSEGGTRCVLERRAEPVEPSTGSVVRVSLTLPEARLSCLAEVARRHPRQDERVELSLRFIGLPETDQDLVRRLVFSRLRELRRRGLL